MKVFKFGGASVKDAKGIKNVASVLQQVGYDDVFLVVSAMGKMTNAFEKLTHAYCEKEGDRDEILDHIKEYHHTIIEDLFEDKSAQIRNKIGIYFAKIDSFFAENTSTNYDYIYDQIVSQAELISTTIVSKYLSSIGVLNTWIDVREYIKTDDEYRGAKVDWQRTEKNIKKSIVKNGTLYITQGFLGRSNNGHTTTLGREGSDYTAGIFAYCLDAENVTIWKDVEGVLNADPRYFKEAQLLEKISYTEAIELAFYGASVIHPKTLQPLQKKEIPLYVKSFLQPKSKGTSVSRGLRIYPEMPCFIVKKNQILLSISSLDFSFIVERNISEIFRLLHDHKMKVNLIQNSAISFSVCLDDKYHNFDTLLEELKSKFKIEYFPEVSLYTIRHFTKEAISTIEKDNGVLLKQLSQETVQMVIE
ncbi:MAG: aspartate kinase [Flavobacteriaceae bacterium]|nr:aspartate kinase [Flavobacteriaceae bacterium]